MRLLFLLILAGVGAYFTVPTQAAHEEAAQAYLQTLNPTQQESFRLEDVVGYVRGMMAGQGRYESYYLVSKYSVDLPGAAFLECYGAYTIVRCQEAGADAPS